MTSTNGKYLWSSVIDTDIRYGYASHGGDRQTIEVMTSKCYSYALLKISLMVSYENELKYFK